MDMDHFNVAMNIGGLSRSIINDVSVDALIITTTVSETENYAMIDDYAHTKKQLNAIRSEFVRLYDTGLFRVVNTQLWFPKDVYLSSLDLRSDLMNEKCVLVDKKRYDYYKEHKIPIETIDEICEKWKDLEEAYNKYLEEHPGETRPGCGCDSSYVRNAIGEIANSLQWKTEMPE